jgi:hypothetical protein
MSFDATKYTQSPWLHGADLPAGQPIEMTISGAREHTFTDGTTRPVVEFSGMRPALSLNKTQVQTLVALFGANADAWKGQRITLTAVPTQLGKPTILIGRAGPPQPPTAFGQPAPATVGDNPFAAAQAAAVTFRQG